MHLFAEYGLFLTETITLVIAILILLAGILAIAGKGKGRSHEKIIINKINKRFDELKHALQKEIFDKSQLKAAHKAEKQTKKTEKKSKKTAPNAKHRIFVVNFHGDIKASAVQSLREEISAILTIATPDDEVLVRLESAGGMVHTYGLAASQLKRIRDRNIPLTVAIDAVAASGGYLMACVANRIVAAPFAIIGSIGVVAQLPNFHRLLKKHNIDFEQISAGEYKRTLTLFGDNTKEGRHKFQEQVDEIHRLFKEFISENRPSVDVNRVATGEHWLAHRAFEFHLVDKLQTSDDYLMQKNTDCDIYEVKYQIKRSLGARLSGSLAGLKLTNFSL